MQLRRGTHTPIKSSSGTDKYVLGTRIGKGQFGKVYRAKTLIESMEYAIKVIPTLKVKRNPKLKLLLQNEIEILSKLKHPNIIEFHELYCDESNIYMVYELCSQDTLQDRLPLPQQELVHVFRQIIEACAYAEKNRALHRDLKPANILFKSGKVKVADWGFSRELHTNELTQSFLGSPAYMAPEVLNGELYSSQADVWSMGVMLYECLYGRLPWDTSSIQNLQALQKSQPLHIELKTPPVLRAILQRSLTLDERKRASFQ